MSEFQFNKWWAYYCGERGIAVDRKTLNKSRENQWLAIAAVGNARKGKQHGLGT